MAKVTSKTGKDHYRVTITAPSGNSLIADEPAENGGQNNGFAPSELLAASLAACTSITLRMYADRKEWDLTDIFTEIEMTTNDATSKTSITRKIHLTGNLDETQRARLMDIAHKCPVHKILSGVIEISSQFV